MTGYKQFCLDDAGRQRIFEAYRAQVTLIAESVDPALPLLPKCRDPDDQMFLELALAGHADMLISRDNQVLKLARARQRPCPFAILAPEYALRRLFAAASAIQHQA